MHRLGVSNFYALLRLDLRGPRVLHRSDVQVHNVLPATRRACGMLT